MALPGKQQIGELVNEHYASLFRYAYRLTGSSADAEDLTQETFCQAQAKWSQLRDSSRVRSWLYSILRNSYLHKSRAEKLHPQVALDDWEEVAEYSLPEGMEVDPRLLQQALQQLPEEFRTPVILFYFEEFTYREIADQMEVPLGTIMSRLARAKAYLRSQLLENETVAESQRTASDGL